MNFKILIPIILITLFFSCKKEDPCPISKDLGSLIWSDETKSWIPSEYFEIPHSLKYISGENEEKIFNLDISELVGTLSWTTEVECENGEGTTNYSYKAERYTGRFTTADSLWMFFGLGVRNEVLAINDRTEVDFYEWVSMSIHNANDATIDYDYGDVYIVTDMRNVELEDIDHTVNRYIFHDNLDINGNTFEDVYTELNPEDSPADIIYKRGEGIVAFIDENGKFWKLEK